MALRPTERRQRHPTRTKKLNQRRGPKHPDRERDIAPKKPNINIIIDALRFADSIASETVFRVISSRGKRARRKGTSNTMATDPQKSGQSVAQRAHLP